MEVIKMNLWIELVVMLVYGLLCGAWVKLFLRHANPGWRRLQAALPVLILNCLLPFLFNPIVVPQRNPLFSALPRMIAAFVFMWIGNFKILAYCLNRGLLKDAETLSFRQFCGVLICAVHPKSESEIQRTLQEKVARVARWLGFIILKFGFALVFSFPITDRRYNYLLNRFGYCACTYLFLSLSFDYASVVALTVFNVDSHDAFDKPFLSKDTSDFWGRRWNTMTATVLKHLSYDLVIDGKLIDVQGNNAPKQQPTDLQKGLATMSIFLLSGAIHEVLFWYVANEWIWEWFVFFVIFAVALIAERYLKRVYSKQLGLPTAPLVIRTAATFMFHFIVYALFFAPPLKRYNIPRLFEAYQYLVLGSQDQYVI